MGTTDDNFRQNSTETSIGVGRMISMMNHSRQLHLFKGIHSFLINQRLEFFIIVQNVGVGKGLSMFLTVKTNPSVIGHADLVLTVVVDGNVDDGSKVACDFFGLPLPFCTVKVVVVDVLFSSKLSQDCARNAWCFSAYSTHSGRRRSA
jgi:hypothetical protein